MFDLNDPETTDQQRELTKLINDIVFGRVKSLPEPTHNAPKRKQ